MSTSPFEPLRREKLSETVAARLRDEIVEGGLQPGERLPGHRELAEAFSVGLSSIREAISMLASEELIETRAGRGTFVRERAPRSLTLGHQGSPWSQREVEELIEARETLELALAAMAAERAAAEDVAILRGRLTKMELALEDAAAFAEADLQLHLAIAAAARNRFLEQAMEQLGALLRQSMEVSSSAALRRRGDLSLSLASHKRLVDQIEAGEPEKARAELFEIMTRHHENVLGDAA
jgi:GntR family transcriptional repressor for pyruvate dehydrogenase complex